MKAKIEIRIWSDGDQPDNRDLPELFQPHAERVAVMLAEGYISGEIIGDGHRGWWDIITD